MRTLLVLLTLSCGIYGTLAGWKTIDIRNVIAMMKDVPQVGFEPRNRGGGGGDIPIYLCMTSADVNQYLTPGKLIYRPNGDFVCYVADLYHAGNKEISYRYNFQHQRKILILKTPAECYSWVPHTPRENRRKNWVGDRWCPNPICRVYDPNSGYLIPGMMNNADTHCEYPYSRF